MNSVSKKLSGIEYPNSIVDEEWEYLDPTPGTHCKAKIFLYFLSFTKVIINLKINSFIQISILCFYSLTNDFLVASCWVLKWNGLQEWHCKYLTICIGKTSLKYTLQIHFVYFILICVLAFVDMRGGDLVIATLVWVFLFSSYVPEKILLKPY